MGSPGTAEGMEMKKIWQVEKPYHLVIEFHELPSGHQFFPLVPRMGSQETITGTKTENV